jgi:hypothetical protein
MASPDGTGASGGGDGGGSSPRARPGDPSGGDNAGGRKPPAAAAAGGARPSRPADCAVFATDEFRMAVRPGRARRGRGRGRGLPAGGGAPHFSQPSVSPAELRGAARPARSARPPSPLACSRRRPSWPPLCRSTSRCFPAPTGRSTTGEPVWGWASRAAGIRRTRPVQRAGVTRGDARGAAVWLQPWRVSGSGAGAGALGPPRPRSQPGPPPSPLNPKPRPDPPGPTYPPTHPKQARLPLRAPRRARAAPAARQVRVRLGALCRRTPRRALRRRRHVPLRPQRACARGGGSARAVGGGGGGAPRAEGAQGSRQRRRRRALCRGGLAPAAAWPSPARRTLSPPSPPPRLRPLPHPISKMTKTFESYLHPERYRVSMCNDGAACKRKVRGSCGVAVSSQPVQRWLALP